jgi:GxxExxY protein
MDVNKFSGIIVDKAVKIHKLVGPGCYERVYEEILYFELIKAGLKVSRQQLMPLEYEQLYLKDAYKLDLLVEDRIVVEIKSVDYLLPVYFKQVMTYLKLLGLKNGMLLNFKVDLMKEGIHRVFNNNGS